MDVAECRRAGFYVALYQFLFPTIVKKDDGSQQRMQDPGFVSNVDLSVFELLDVEQEPFHQTSAPIEATSRKAMCKNVGPVQRPSLPPSVQNVPAQPQPRPNFVAVPKSSTARRKRTRKTEEDSGRLDGQPLDKRKRTSKRLYFDRLKRQREIVYLCLPMF
jgi:hypothetical protein